ncbi:MAG: nicotinamide riboside transporter PnuC [Gammaproteobacteria bacterium]|nr:nicotinamide riboside transporter PnuC [Gammaproteobacteria bacterium]
MEQLWQYWLVVDEPIGTVLGFVIVWCLIRQNLWAWPLGVAYVVVSVSVLLEARLYANLALHVLGFLPLNLYGWYYWIFGRAPREAVLPVTRASRASIAALAGACVAGTAILGTLFSWYTDAALPYWDNGLFVASLAAMWLTARKKIENWLFWFIIDVVSVGVYWAQGLPLYASLYFVYLAMAVAGWRSWKTSMTASDPDHAR